MTNDKPVLRHGFVPCPFFNNGEDHNLAALKVETLLHFSDHIEKDMRIKNPDKRLATKDGEEKGILILNVIDHLHSTGRLATGADVQALRDAVRDLNAEVTRHNKRMDRELGYPTGTPSDAQEKHAAVIRDCEGAE